MPGAHGPKTVKGAQSDPNYVSRLLLDYVPVFHKIITPGYLLYRPGLSIWTSIRGSKVHRRKAIDQYTKRVGFNLLYNGCKTNANIEVFGVGAEMFHLRP